MDNGGQRILLCASITATLQMWTDMQFVWDPTEYDGITFLSVPRENIWFPDVMAVQK
jgi:hypothetical protein